MKLAGIIAGLALLAPVPGPAAVAGGGAKAADPERKICKSRAVVGSRLKRIRECATAQEWEDMQLQEKVGLMRKQTNGDPGCSGSSSASCNPVGTRDTPW
jgi:hypothetical protein